MKRILFTCLVLVLACAGTALADTFVLDTGTGLGTSPFGKIDVTSVDANKVQITVTMYAPDKVLDTGSHHAIAFNISGEPTVSITGLPSGFVLGPKMDDNPPFGVFGYTIDCPGCGPGSTNAKPGPITFYVSSASGLTPSAFIANSTGAYFSADILGSNGQTGVVAAMHKVDPVPEPGSLALLGSGLLGIGGYLRRRVLG